MRWLPGLGWSAAVLLILCFEGAQAACQKGHSLEAVMNSGSILKLDDGSVWKVDDADASGAALWLPAADIVVCEGKLINTDDGEPFMPKRWTERYLPPPSWREASADS